MFNEAKRLNVDMRGGLILDKMGIQDDLQMSFHGGKNTVNGLVDVGGLTVDIYFLNTHNNELRLATYVMQFLFLSYDGFNFPFAYFSTTGANAYINVWEAISFPNYQHMILLLIMFALMVLATTGHFK